MAEQRLLYSIEGDASGLKKALAESEAAHRRLTVALTRKGVEIAALKNAEDGLKKIDAAAAEARRKMEFFRRSAEIAPGGIKQFSKDIDKASKDLARLAQQATAQRAQIAGLRGAAGGTGAEIAAAKEGLANANAQKRVALLEAERQARINYGKQVLAGLQAQALETERVAAIERRRAADDAANARAAAANARVRAAAQQNAAQQAQALSRLQTFAGSLPRFDIKGNAAAKLAEINAAAAKSKQALNDALAAARNFGSGGQSAAQGFSGQLKSMVVQALAVTTAIKGIGSVVSAGITSQRLEAKFEFAAAGDTAKAASDLAFVRAEAERLALPIAEAADGFSKLAASTQGTQVEGEKTRQIFTGISSAMRVLGAPTYQVERAFNAVVQSISKGNLQAEEIRGQLGESIPGAFRIMANALGVSMEQLDRDLKKGLVNGADAMVKFAAELERLSKSGLLTATSSFQAQMVRLQNTLFDLRDTLAKAGVLDAFGAEITALTEKLREMADTGELQTFAKDFAQIIGTLARILGEATRLAIEHRDTLASLALLFAGFKIAKGVQGVAVAWTAASAAMAGAGTAIVGVTGKARILFALLGGPLGIGAAIITAALAWETFREKATDALDAVIKRSGDLRTGLSGEITTFNAGDTSGVDGYAQAVKRVAQASTVLLGLEKERAALQQKLAKQGLSEGGLARTAAARLSDAAIANAKDDLAKAEGFVRESAGLMAREDKFKPKPKPPTAVPGKQSFGGVTRLPELRDQFNAELELTKSALEDQSKVLESALAGQLIDVRSYWLAKRGIAEQQLGLEQKTLEKQLADQENLIRRLASFERRKPGVNAKGKPTGESAAANQGEALEGKLLAARNKAAELRVQLAALDGKKITTDFELKVNTDKALRDIADAVAQARAKVAQLQGNETDADRRAAVAVGYRKLLSEVAGDVKATALIDKLIDVEAASANLDALQRKWSLALEAMRNTEQSVDVLQKQGLITTVGAQNQIAAAHRTAALELEKLLPLMDAAANAIGDEAVAKVAAWKNELAGVKAVVDPVAESINTSLKGAFSQMFNDIGSSAKTAKEAVLDFARAFVQTINQAASKQLGETLFNSLSGGGGASGGIGGFFSRLMGTAPGGKNDGSSVAAALYVRPVGAAGGLGLSAGGDKTGDAAGALGDTTSLFGGLFESIKGIFSGIGSTISGLFKSLASSISGLFSSGGSGGGGGGGSNVGGWISTIASLFGYADGGWTGPGGKYQPAGIVHADEFVFDKASTNRIGVGVLENMRRIASGRFVSPRPRMSYAEGGLVNLPGSAPPTVNANTKVVNMFDLDSALAEYLNTRGGERAVLNVIQRNPSAVGG